MHYKKTKADTYLLGFAIILSLSAISLFAMTKTAPFTITTHETSTNSDCGRGNDGAVSCYSKFTTNLKETSFVYRYYSQKQSYINNKFYSKDTTLYKKELAANIAILTTVFSVVGVGASFVAKYLKKR